MTNYSATFLRVVRNHIHLEGGYSNDPLDPGGKTKFGISKRFNPQVDVESLTEEGAMAIYHEKYWHPMRLDEIRYAHVAQEMFDIGAGPNGPTAAAKIAQGALILLGSPVKLDGIIGNETLSALNNYRYPDDLVKLMNCLQWTHMLLGNANMEEIIEMVRKRLPLLRTFVRGWLKRIEIPSA